MIFSPNIKRAILFILALSVVGGFFVFYRQQSNMYIENVKRIQQLHEEEIRKINSAYEDERKQHEINIGKLQAELNDVKSKYDAATQVLNTKKKIETRKIVAKYSDDPVGLATKVSEVTGFKVVTR